ncbi:hypothetical protein CXG81DRAFT_11056 [Caulochytrium protostelioides]|uniref:Chromatin modification-related protein EAF3 n=1 Tax=Caulochytrium protostelioides TaxID=1555241 RepID=A0A4V1IUY9_9FUNG|nr:hypothetical protein CXG81DRAFT_11056 [Caulochytrium protostelioides]|eukprot:RKP02219.1 hypothetical protein CXG81DRAFT_11056 [Caulochytrium protostelioides]
MASLPFEKNERVLCFHGPLLYEAKVLDADLNEDLKTSDVPGPQFFVHYKGWKQKWDEWVPLDRVLKWNDANLKRQADLRDGVARNGDHGGATAAGGAGPSTSGGGGYSASGGLSGSRKRARDSTLEREEAFLQRPEIKFNIPDILKGKLVDDWEEVTKNAKIMRLPAKVPVSAILTQYAQEAQHKRKDADVKAEDTMLAVTRGLKDYFDRSLGNTLLYRFERPQYVTAKQDFPGKAPSDLYGAEHLLRLFVQLPSLLAYTNMDAEAMSILKEHFTDILKYIHRQYDTFFTNQWECASPSYAATVKSP